MTNHHITDILLGFCFRQITNVNIENTTLGCASETIDNYRIFQHTQLIEWLDCFVKVRKDHTIAMIHDATVCVADRIFSNLYALCGCTRLKACYVIKEVFFIWWNDKLRIGTNDRCALDWLTDFANASWINVAKLLDTCAWVLDINHDMIEHAPVNIPTTKNVIS